ncbi:Uncharacterized protein TCAP_04999 [Tolypocladium capitatum]|uniref:Uncharacterized protein n=1 Tax=Tolypocladium capitatum TaxID=45235 RepID=A0A2K3QC17_9HYPO|nr:Uncharacterized protein TCAP_04999 [Tolypocladium capitatum]
MLRFLSSITMKPEASHLQQDLWQQDELPPPYDLDKGPSLAQDSDADSDSNSDLHAISEKCPPDWQTGPFNLQMAFISNAKAHFANDARNVAWEARLEVHTKDIFRLMKQGFYFTEANVRKRKGYFVLDENSIAAHASNCGWSRARVYHLTDRPEDGNRQWIAVLRVYARELSVLSDFRVRYLSADKLHITRAYNQKGQVIYDYDVKHPRESFNAVYNNRPLGGWWPWPKESRLNE